MLTRFAVTNYRGFRKTVVLDLVHPRDYAFNTSALKHGVIKNAILYGANGSGKTNLSLAMFDIVNHLSLKWKKSDYYDNFVAAGSADKEVHFAYSFLFGQDILSYAYSKDAMGRLTQESLVVNGKLVFSKRAGSFHLVSPEFVMSEREQEHIRNDANAVSVINYLLSSYPLPPDHYLIKLRDFVSSMLWFTCRGQSDFLGLETIPSPFDSYIIAHSLMGSLADFLATVSGQHFEFVPRERKLFCLMGSSLVPFDEIASTGTHALMVLFFWLQHIKEASFVFLDDVDAFYHFQVSDAVCELLFREDCQVLLSTHNTSLMTNDLLRPDCYFLIRDNEVKPLCDCTDKELRFSYNMEKLYRGGTFG